MEQTGLFATTIRIAITLLMWLWVLFSLSGCGAFIGLLVNQIIDQSELYPKIIYSFTGIGFLFGLYKAESL